MTENFVERVWEMMEKIGTAMLITWDGERQRARPMSAHVSQEEHAIYFITPADQEKTDQIEKFPIVTLTFADTGGQKYVVTTGHATVSNDRAKIKELWSPFAKAWFDSFRRSKHPRAEGLARGCRDLGCAGQAGDDREDAGGSSNQTPALTLAATGKDRSDAASPRREVRI